MIDPIKTAYIAGYMANANWEDEDERILYEKDAERNYTADVDPKYNWYGLSDAVKAVQSLHLEIKDTDSAIRVWRGRTERAERFTDGGEWCDWCNAPQWVEVDGSHACMSISALQQHIKTLEAGMRGMGEYMKPFLNDKDDDTPDMNIIPSTGNCVYCGKPQQGLTKAGVLHTDFTWCLVNGR